jgi:electron transfer flavoprotein beta subunit
MAAAAVGVCVNWVDSIAEPGDDRYAGVSAADQAALELALQQAAQLGSEVRAVTVGRAAAQGALRLALACGAADAVRVDVSTHDESVIARLLCDQLRDCQWVWCGDYSPDGGTGAVPAFLAAELRAPQALGVIDVQLGTGAVVATRRLDGGRRERLSLQRGVVSVEGSVALLRRAPLAAVLAAERSSVRTVPASASDQSLPPAQPYRPRARSVPTPRGESTLDRLRQITDAGSAPARGEVVVLDPPAAAARIVTALEQWAYLSPTPPSGRAGRHRPAAVAPETEPEAPAATESTD